MAYNGGYKDNKGNILYITFEDSWSSSPKDNLYLVAHRADKTIKLERSFEDVLADQNLKKIEDIERFKRDLGEGGRTDEVSFIEEIQRILRTKCAQEYKLEEIATHFSQF